MAPGLQWKERLLPRRIPDILVGCYCGCVGLSNQARWAGTVLLCVSSVTWFGLTLNELAQCAKPCPGDDKTSSERVKQAGIYVYSCSPTAATHGVLRCWLEKLACLLDAQWYDTLARSLHRSMDCHHVALGSDILR
jgi:hypothetical protein